MICQVCAGAVLPHGAYFFYLLDITIFNNVFPLFGTALAYNNAWNEHYIIHTAEHINKEDVP